MSGHKFYKSAKADVLGDGFGVFLDGRRLVTPAKKPLIVPTLNSAKLIAHEWEMQGENIDTNTMPITRLVNVAIDRAPLTRPELVEEIKKYASSDLCCYRTKSPQILYDAQCKNWDNHIHWIKNKFDIEFITKDDSLGLFQHVDSLNKIGKIAQKYDDIRLTILAFATALAGSAILGLRLVEKEISPDEIFKAIRIEEDHNAKIWGYDPEDLEKAKGKLADIKAAHKLINAI